MKKLFLTILLFYLCSLGSIAQTNATNLPELDKSPMDMSYYPTDFPLLKIQNKVKQPVVTRVIYSRPQKAGRTIFGELIEYGKVWRLGANEATEIEFFKDVNIGGRKISKGRYTLYAIVNPDAWTMIFNKDTDIWGAFKYDSTKDVMRINVPVEKNTEPVEVLTILFEPVMQNDGKPAKNFNLIIVWEYEKVSLPITF